MSGARSAGPSFYKRLIALVLFLIALLGLVAFVSRALSPFESKAGVTWRAYRAEKRDSIDVLFFGSSYLFCGVCPATLYAETGHTSYVVGGPAQAPSLTYYYVREALKTQSPDVIFVDLSCAGYGRFNAYPEIGVGMMPFGCNRMLAALNCAEPARRAGLLFPPYSYHADWNKTSVERIKTQLFDRRTDPAAGFSYHNLPREDAQAETPQAFERTEAFAENLVYLRRIADLCKRRGIQLVFTTAPAADRRPSGYYDALYRDVAFDGVLLLSGEDAFDACAFDPDRDFFDAAHMNYSGAVKYTRCIASFLQPLEDAGRIRYREADAALWAKRQSYVEALFASGYTGEGQALSGQ